jgi:hypothetical protein
MGLAGRYASDLLGLNEGVSSYACPGQIGQIRPVALKTNAYAPATERIDGEHALAAPAEFGFRQVHRRLSLSHAVAMSHTLIVATPFTRRGEPGLALQVGAGLGQCVH